MLEFEMPKKTEKERYEKFKKALEETGIPFGKTFELDIEEGLIVGLAKEKINFQNKQISFGCVANPPHFSYWTINDSWQVAYKRNLHSSVKKDGFFKDGIPVLSKISKALSIPQNYYETFWLEKFAPDYAKIKVFSDDKEWRFTFNECENNRSRNDDEENIRYAVNILLDFYQTSNL